MIINLTPHAISVRHPDGSQSIYPPSGTVARLISADASASGEVDGTPVYAVPRVASAIVGLPDPFPGTLYLVSRVVAETTTRPDVIAPGTGPLDGAVRNDAGQVVAVTRFIRFV